MYCSYGDTSPHDACAAEPPLGVADELPEEEEEAALPRPATLLTDARAAKPTFLSSPPEATGPLFAAAAGGAGHSIAGSLETTTTIKTNRQSRRR